MSHATEQGYRFQERLKITCAFLEPSIRQQPNRMS